MAGAAGGFVTRAFEAMLKECAANRGKFAALQQSIQSCLGACPLPASSPAHWDLSVADDGAAVISVAYVVADSIKGATAEGAVITEALASAGRVLEGPQAELVLQPLRLAVETKHVKLGEPALDCLHVINQSSSSPLFFSSFACLPACLRQ